MRLRSPIRMIGGKGRMVKKIMPYLTAWSHKCYVEPFGGGASLLMAKESVETEVYNDVNEGLVNFFRVLKDPEVFDRFRACVTALPYSEAIYNECRQTWEAEGDRVTRAAKWYVVGRQSFSGGFGEGWDPSNVRWLSSLKQLPEVHLRLQQIQIECADWRAILERYDAPETLFYLDPPYVCHTRRAKRYAHELSDDDHKDLARILLSIKGRAVLSGYPNDIYKPLDDAGWARTYWTVPCHAVARTKATGLQGRGSVMAKQTRIESLWIKDMETGGVNEQGTIQEAPA